MFHRFVLPTFTQWRWYLLELMSVAVQLAVATYKYGAMLQDVFQSHGHFCASHPLEIVVATVTVIMSLMSLGTTVQYDDKLCGWNYLCAKEQEVKGTDVIILSIGRCIALVYTYLQFRNLRRFGSKHLLGISGVFTIFSSFIFCIAFAKMFGNTLSGLSEALPFFLFLIDLSKASALAAFALSSRSREEISKNISHGMALLGPDITLDTIVETLVIGVGTLSGVKQLETMCYFGCLSVVANYVAFMTFYPACLTLVLELSRDLSGQEVVGQYQCLAKKLHEEHEIKKTNPVIRRVKIIMSVGLAVVHIHSRFIAPCTGLVEPGTSLDATDTLQPPDMPLWKLYLFRIFAVHVDYGLTLILGVVLLVKYFFVDRHADYLDIKQTIEYERSLSSVTMETQTDVVEAPSTSERVSFSLGVGDVDEDEPAGASPREHKQTQTDLALKGLPPLKLVPSTPPRNLKDCVALLNSENGVAELSDGEVLQLVRSKHIPAYKLEGMLGDCDRGVAIRRQLISKQLTDSESIENLPYTDFDYTNVDGACCENVVGYMPLPLGVAGPLLLDNHEYMVPMATTEGCLVASTNRGCRALSQSGGVHSVVLGDGMTRGPVVRLPSALAASEVKLWLEENENFDSLKEHFDMTSRFARLARIQSAQAGRLLYLRFVASTGDAMGMNMLSKGTERALQKLHETFPDMELLSLSGNYCTDKKSSAINWIEGRGKSVVCEAVIPSHVVQKTLKTSVRNLVDLNITKNLVGSAMAGSIGGFNAHAANIVSALFIATGQDPAQTMGSANCITLMEGSGPAGDDLYITCTMPSLEVGTVGGGTILPPQAACLQMLGVQGSCEGNPGENARQLARVICATVLAAELSLMSALAAGHLVRSHLTHNRSSINVGSISSLQSPSSSATPASSATLPVPNTTIRRIPAAGTLNTVPLHTLHSAKDATKLNTGRDVPKPNTGIDAPKLKTGIDIPKMNTGTPVSVSQTSCGSCRVTESLNSPTGQSRGTASRGIEEHRTTSTKQGINDQPRETSHSISPLLTRGHMTTDDQGDIGTCIKHVS